MVNSLRLLEERFAIGLRFEVKGKEIRRLQLPKALLAALVSDFRIPNSPFNFPPPLSKTATYSATV
jgi:hypothetical protein